MSSDKNIDIEGLRNEYALEELEESGVSADPMEQFRLWFEQALRSEVTEANAMSLATATKDAKPSVRIVLLKGFDQQGFRFFTNYESRKGRELQENPFASLCFFWPELERQIRIEGSIEKVSREESVEYFEKRPRLSQLGAWASSQSDVLESREELEKKFTDLDQKFKNSSIPAPEHWGGYRLLPSSIEFWQGRTGRLHDRLRYIRESGTWNLYRLSP